MPGPNTARLGLPTSIGGDPPNGPAQMNALANLLDTIAVEVIRGALSAMPAAAVYGRVYQTTDAGPVSLFWDTGTAWASFGQGSLVTTKGDLVVGTGPATEARLGVGADGYALTARSTAADGVDWEPVVASALVGTATIKTYNEARVLLNPAGASPVIDLSAANEFSLDLSANATVSFINVPTGTNRVTVGVSVKQPAAGTYTLSWPASVIWGVEGAPPLTGGGLTDLYGMASDDNGTTWRAWVINTGFTA